MADEYTDQEKRRILLELRFFYTEDEICKKWKLTKSQIRKWKKAANYAYLTVTFREMVIIALHNGTNTTAAMIRYLDYLDHSIYTESEIETVLKGLHGEGIAKEESGLWFYDLAYSKNDTSYIL